MSKANPVAIAVRFSAIAAMALSMVLLPAASPPGEIYVLSAASNTYGAETFPADLYAVSAGKLQKLRRLVTPAQGIESVIVGDGAFAILYPHPAPSRVDFIHFDAPDRVDSIPLKMSDGEFALSAVPAQSSGRDPVLAILIAGGEGRAFHQRLIGIRLRHGSTPRVVDPLPWRDLVSLRFQGEIGGWDTGNQSILFLPTSRRGGLVLHSPVWAILLLPLVQPDVAEGRQVPAEILCSNESYLIFERDPPRGTDIRRKDFSAWIYDREKQHASALRIPGGMSRLRLFGSWLSILVVEPNPDRIPNPGRESMRQTGSAEQPPTRELYEHYVLPLLFPGWTRLVNLKTGQTIDLKTGMADSEVIDISGETVLYRVNSTLFQARIAHGSLTDREELVEDRHVPDVHWAFRRSP